MATISEQDRIVDPSYRSSRTILIDDDESSVPTIAPGTFDRTQQANIEAYRQLNSGIQDLLDDSVRLASFLAGVQPGIGSIFGQESDGSGRSPASGSGSRSAAVS